MRKSSKVIPRGRLEKLGTVIRVEHASAVRHLKDAVASAIRCGKALIEAEALCGGYGKWGPWLQANFPASDRTARGYMQLARAPAKIRREIADLGLTLHAALAFVANPPRLVSLDVTTDKPESGQVMLDVKTEPEPPAQPVSRRLVATHSKEPEPGTAPLLMASAGDRVQRLADRTIEELREFSRAEQQRYVDLVVAAVGIDARRLH